jgi:hypothetical protein
MLTYLVASAGVRLDPEDPLPGVGAASRLHDPQSLAEVRNIHWIALRTYKACSTSNYTSDGWQWPMCWNPSQCIAQVQHVTRQLLQLHKLLGSREDIDVSAMCIREPGCDAMPLVTGRIPYPQHCNSQQHASCPGVTRYSCIVCAANAKYSWRVHALQPAVDQLE